MRVYIGIDRWNGLLGKQEKFLLGKIENHTVQEVETDFKKCGFEFFTKTYTNETIITVTSAKRGKVKGACIGS